MLLQTLTGELYKLYDQQKYDQALKLLPPIKLELIKNNLLFPRSNNTENELNDLKITQRIYEIAGLSSLLVNDSTNFENYFDQLKPFYSIINAYTEESSKITSLYLLYLLSKGKISKFHIELEMIYNSSIPLDKYLSFPINLEKNLMEGNYIKIWSLLKESSSLPSKEFTHFVPTLISALRFEILKSIEKTYLSLPTNNAKNLLYFPIELSDSKFEQSLKEEYEVQHWTFENGKITFGNADKQDEGENILNNVLGYAEQIESII